MKLTVISGIYNEEYLLPFWLEHHRKVFDHGVIIDWHSTDRSLEIVREMCPTWEIRTTINATFGADEIDQELMSVEREFEGYKMVLNTTEFLISTRPIRELILDEPNANYSIQGLGAISSDVGTYPATLQEMMSRVERVNTTRRMYRALFSYPDGRYGLGRHYPTHPVTAEIPAYVMWFGFYPWNERALARKLQIADKIPPHDRARGYSYHHQWDRDEQERQKAVWTAESVPCSEVVNLLACVRTPVAISLGWNCSAAVKGVELGLRKRRADGYLTCPFDEMLTNYDGLVMCLTEDFKHFCDPEYLILREVPITSKYLPGERVIYNTRYNFIFNHESPGHADLYLKENWEGGMNHFVDHGFALFIERYSRRISNFRHYLSSGVPIIFLLITRDNPLTELERALNTLGKPERTIMTFLVDETCEVYSAHMELMKL